MIQARTLSDELASATPPRIIDVRLQEDFEEAHIPGSINNAVYEVAFHDRLQEQLPDLSAPVRICGSCRTSHEAGVALEKLQRAGYQDVRLLEGGVEAWEEAGLPLTRGKARPPAPAPPQGQVPVDLAESKVEWLGRNLLNKHHGCVALKSGSLEFTDGKLTGGSFVLDLTRLDCGDLAGNTLHDVLIHHLQSDDFFDTARYPEARFAITGVEDLGTAAGSPNVRIHGDLTIKDRSHPISFEAAAGLTPEGKPAAQASFCLDRTLWGVLYGSGKFFRNLAGHLVNDLVEFQVRIVGGTAG